MVVLDQKYLFSPELGGIPPPADFFVEVILWILGVPSPFFLEKSAK